MNILKLLFGALLAALASFTWGYLSWEVLGWHTNNTFGFKDETEIREALANNLQAGHGTYMLPHLGELPSFLPPDEKAAKQAAVKQARDDGPFLYATIRPGKKPFNMNQALGLSFTRSFLACLILGGILSGFALPYAKKVFFCAAMGLFAGLAADVPDWIWFELRGSDLFVAIADHLLEWTAAGCVLAVFVGLPMNHRHED